MIVQLKNGRAKVQSQVYFEVPSPDSYPSTLSLDPCPSTLILDPYPSTLNQGKLKNLPHIHTPGLPSLHEAQMGES